MQLEFHHGLLRQKRAGLALAPIVADRGRRVLAFAVSAMLAVGGSVVALRAYQQRHVAGLLESYL